MSTALVGFLVSAIVYGVSAAFSVRFDNRRNVSVAGSLAPAVILLGLALPTSTSTGWMVVGPIVAVFVSAVRRNAISDTLSHPVLFGVALGVVAVSERMGAEELVAGLLAGALYLAGDGVRQALTGKEGHVGRRRSDRLSGSYWVLHAVLLCACGLTVLGVQEMDWPAFTAMAFVLTLTKHEFEGFARSRDAFDQTVAAIDQLKQRAVFASDER